VLRSDQRRESPWGNGEKFGNSLKTMEPMSVTFPLDFEPVVELVSGKQTTLSAPTLSTTYSKLAANGDFAT
jgi:hypothetical protein